MHRYYDEAIRAQFVEIRPRNVQLELQEHGALAQYLTLDEMRARFQYPPIGDVRGQMLLSEINKGQPLPGGKPALMIEQEAEKKAEEKAKEEEAALQRELETVEQEYLTLTEGIDETPETPSEETPEASSEEAPEETKSDLKRSSDIVDSETIFGVSGWYKGIKSPSRLAIVHEIIQWQRKCHHGILKSRIPSPRKPTKIPREIIDVITSNISGVSTSQDVDRIFQKAIKEYVHEGVVRSEA
jgi:hypothetical protein